MNASRAVITQGVPPTTHQHSSGLPFSLVLGLLSGLALLASASTELRDIDLYWHLLAGQHLASGGSPSTIGQSWSFAPVAQGWTSTQWVAEFLMHVTYDLAGWAGLVTARVATAAIAIACLAWSTLRGRPRAVAGFPYVLAVAAVAFVSQERPQQVTLIGAAIAGGLLAKGVVRQELPRWWILLPLIVFWANSHGGWVIVPFVLVLIALGNAIDNGFRSLNVRRSLLLAGATLLAGSLTPSGPFGLLAPLRFREATVLVNEWEPTAPVSALGLLSILMLGGAAIGWARAPRVPLSEVFAVLLCLIFAWSAWRNLAPGLALVAPLVAHSLARAFPQVGRPEPRWSAPLGITSAIVLTLIALVSIPGRQLLPVDTQPVGLAQRISDLEPGQKVLNHYNVAGLVLFFGGSETQVGIDGRADLYGEDYIGRYVGLNDLRGDWEQTLNDLAPTSALIPHDSGLAFVLIERGWDEVGRENDWVLLKAPPVPK